MSYGLTENQWTDILSITSLLKPFMVIQEYLEAEKYVTISSIPIAINKIRTRLEEVLAGDTDSEAVKQLAKVMLEDFNVRWGSGIPGTVFNEHKTLGIS